MTCTVKLSSFKFSSRINRVVFSANSYVKSTYLLLKLNASKKWFAQSFVQSVSSFSSYQFQFYKELREPPKTFPTAKHLSSYSPLLVGIVDIANVYLHCSEQQQYPDLQLHQQQLGCLSSQDCPCPVAVITSTTLIWIKVFRCLVV